jgi:hypothetical protein
LPVVGQIRLVPSSDLATAEESWKCLKSGASLG